ncbi:hypothetical protein [Pontibacillus marinus]|uniref:Uncharacterized protein n=1 Tax=Pontibacillus marinus BH030004 = DSM 16465 TaxID=1385511 RepID=A0A0A5G0Q8_9BACI|nr:hypothetical protein [Pontibacillus marinus]KGX85619.1 hypothetical protein N783_14085 [Pontibacillus marinus BH030004 = DSM 16465]
MKNNVRYFILFIVFSASFTFGVWLLDVLEGSKITNTEHVDLNGGLLFIVWMFTWVLFGAIMVPLTLSIDKFINHVVIRVLIYSLVGYLFGMVVFHRSFEHIQTYELNEMTSSLIFLGVGLLYAITDQYTYRKVTDDAH